MLGIFFGLVVIAALVGLGVKAWAPGFDLQTLETIARHRDGTLTSIAHVVTNAGSFALLAPLSIALLLLRLRKRLPDAIALVVIAAGCAALPSLVKLIVHRPRPMFEHLIELSSSSFPSEHTTQAAGIYLAIAILLSKDLYRGWGAFIIGIAVVVALAVAWSRVYLGVHYPTDVAAGLLLGWSWAPVVFRWARPALVAAR